MDRDSQTVQTFHWRHAREELAPLLGKLCFQFNRGRGAFEAEDQATGTVTAVVPPIAVPLPKAFTEPTGEETAQAFARRVRRAASQAEVAGDDLATYLRELPEDLPLQCVILVQAGATALAMLLGGEPLATKAFKRYVTRGNGRAQPTYLAQKGKSRYGARLRLQNARRMIEETNERLHGYWDEFGEPDQLLVSAPKRLWADLFFGKPKPPFTKDTPITRIPLGVEVPTTSVLLRAYRALEYGRIERRPLEETS